MERPVCISKLAFYLQDREPLIYLFIINSDFIPVERGDLPHNAEFAVAYEKRRIRFLYVPEALERYNRNEIFFIVIHEAFHIFKRHHIRHEKFKYKLLANIAEDAIINNEISRASYGYNFKPIEPAGCAKIPQKFINEHRVLGEDAFVSDRLYNWYLKQKIKKEDLLFIGAYVKIDKTGEYGKIVDIRNGKYTIMPKTKEEMFEDYEKHKIYGR